jgi:hypothetical protein
VKGAVPFAATVKLADAPDCTVVAFGCDIIVGGIKTFSVAALLVAEPAMFETNTE